VRGARGKAGAVPAAQAGERRLSDLGNSLRTGKITGNFPKLGPAAIPIAV